MQMEIEMSHFLLSPGHDFFGRHGKGRLEHGVTDVDEMELVAGKGIRGDRFYDWKEDYKGQITFFEAEVWEAVKCEFSLPDLSPKAFRRNVVIRGVDLNTLIGKVFRIGQMTFRGAEEARPCYWMDEACAPGVEDFLKGKGGLRCRILEGGTLKKGESLLTVEA